MLLVPDGRGGRLLTPTEPLTGCVTPEPSTFQAPPAPVPAPCDALTGHDEVPGAPWLAVTVPDTDGLAAASLNDPTTREVTRKTNPPAHSIHGRRRAMVMVCAP
jgi:hypothetical protein